MINWLNWFTQVIKIKGVSLKMPYCVNCGYQIERPGSTCPSCGKTMPTEISQQIAGAVDKAAQFSEKAIPKVQEQLKGEQAHFITPTILIFTFICLFFPFVSLAMFSINGMQLAFGVDVGLGLRIGGHWAGVLLLLTIIAGIGLSFWKKNNNHIIIIVVSAFALILLLGLAVGINGYMARQLGSFIDVRMGAGFYLMFLSFIAVCVLNYLFIKNKNV